MIDKLTLLSSVIRNRFAAIAREEGEPAGGYASCVDLRQTKCGLPARLSYRGRHNGIHKLDIVNVARQGLPRTQEIVESIFPEPQRVKIYRVDLAVDLLGLSPWFFVTNARISRRQNYALYRSRGAVSYYLQFSKQRKIVFYDRLRLLRKQKDPLANIFKTDDQLTRIEVQLMGAAVRNLEVPKRAERVLSADEEVTLLVACDRVRSRSLRPLVVLALNTGLRRGELLSLEWARVDLDQRTIRILNAKSEAGRRVIPMNATVHSLLSDLTKISTSPLVFPSNRKRGEKLLDLKKGFKKAVQLAGIPHIRFHDLRHTFATRLIRASVDIITVQKLLGHSKITMTERYAHSLADVKMAAVSKLDLAGVCSVPDPNRTPGPNGVVAESMINTFVTAT